MGERKGQNKYYPPDFDPKKHRSLDAYHGTHALRERARKLGQGILIIRFEMPYNIWCDGCKNPVGMGVRYNAEKSKVGMYYSTPIYKFRMKCHLCDNHYEIKTDPANHDYVIISGARRKEQRWDPKQNEQIVPEDKDDQKKMATDAMYKLQHGKDDQDKGKGSKVGISNLTSAKQQWKDDYGLNRLIRDKFREKKKTEKAEADRDRGILDKYSLDLDLVPENMQDKKMAELLQYRTVISYTEKQKQKRDEIQSRPIFQSSKLTKQKTAGIRPFTCKSSKRTGGPSVAQGGIVRKRNVSNATVSGTDNIVGENEMPESSDQSDIGVSTNLSEHHQALVENPETEDMLGDVVMKTPQQEESDSSKPEISHSISNCDNNMNNSALNSLAIMYSDSSDEGG